MDRRWGLGQKLGAEAGAWGWGLGLGLGPELLTIEAYY